MTPGSTTHCVDASWQGFTDQSNAHKAVFLCSSATSTHAMHEHTTKAIATLGTEAPVIKSIATPEAEAILTKAVATLEHVETLDMMRVAVVEESNGATTLPDADENQMPTIEGGDTLGRDGDRDKVANVCY